MGEDREKRYRWSGLKTAYDIYELLETVEKVQGWGKDKRRELVSAIKESILFLVVATLAIGLTWVIDLAASHLYYALRVVK